MSDDLTTAFLQCLLLTGLGSVIVALGILVFTAPRADHLDRVVYAVVGAVLVAVPWAVVATAWVQFFGKSVL
jgi:uncharacterized protein (UPF0212 family)